MKLRVSVFNPDHPVMNAAWDWGIGEYSTQPVPDQPFKIASVPVLFDDPDSYNYHAPMQDLDLSTYDLVLLSDIEYTDYTKIYEWIGRKQIQSFALAVGGLFEHLPVDPRQTVYRPWWMKNVMTLNHHYVPPSTTAPRPYLFDVLLGTRRPHRDYVMLQFQKHQPLLDRSIVCYRHVFTPGKIPLDSARANAQDHARIAAMFPDLELQWPYVSANLRPEWEVADEITNTVSQTIPDKIYSNTWYSVICETVYLTETFFMAEKFTKTVLAHRPFVLFGPPGYLARLRQLGFQTFDSVIDESYDLERIAETRYKLAWAQVLSLSHQDPQQVYARLQCVLSHNRQHLDTLWQQTVVDRQRLLCAKIPAEFIESAD
jgi:hypothetical protein